ncbi:MAG: alpha/beta fold hydrolase [Anaerolineae bacterium]
MIAEAETVTIKAADGYELGGTLFRAGENSPVVIVHGATAVPHQFYRRFAQFFQAKGWSVLTYDFRGIGVSAHESLIGFDATCGDWGLLDVPAVLLWAEENLAPSKIYFVGHSAGGQQAGLLEEPSSVDGMVTVSAQSGYWGLQGGNEKLKVFFMVWLIIPIWVRLMGYLPWSKLAKAEDLPRNVALQWAKWCRHPDYILSEKSLPLERYKNFAASVLAYSIDDDDWGTAPSVDAMMLKAYPNVERRHLIPAEYGIPKLGHMGFFRKGSELLWQEVFEWLNQH